MGPNGGGKSNILDAIMFCFCDEKRMKRYYDLREVIYREDKEAFADMAERGAYCQVEAVLVAENGRKISLRRRLTARK